MTDEIALAALMCSRLCHDLISPVGAFNNGLEILADENDPDMRGQVLELLTHSAGQTAARLKFFRLAFGAGGGFGEEIAADDLSGVVTDYFAGGKIVVDWRPSLMALPKGVAKIILNLSLLAGDVLPRGGGITIEASRAAAALEVKITAQGERLLLAEGVTATLAGATAVAQLDAKLIPGYLAARLAAAAGGQVSVLTDGERAATFLLRMTA